MFSQKREGGKGLRKPERWQTRKVNLCRLSARGGGRQLKWQGLGEGGWGGGGVGGRGQVCRGTCL